MVYAFWGTVARFAEPAATLATVEHWRGYTRECTRHEKVQDANYEAAAQREHSERARRAAKARWTKHRKAGKAVRS